MELIIDLREEALVHRQEKRYEEAIPLYRRMWESDRENCNAWDAWGYAYSLRQCRCYDEALDICREAYLRWPDFELLCTLYAWCIYHTEFQGEGEKDAVRLLRAGRAIIKLCTADDEYGPFAPAVIRMMTFLLSRPKPEAAACLAWSELLKPEALSPRARQIVLKEGRTIELASPREQYYAARIKALFLEKDWERCIRTSEAALRLDPLHYDNDLWFRRYAALAHLDLGQTEDALNLLNYILARRRAWFILMDAAVASHEAGKPEQALTYALEAALSQGPPEMKVKLYRQLALWLHETDHKDAARRTTVFACQVRRVKKWRADEQLLDLAEALDVDPAPSTPFRKLQRNMERSLEKLLLQTGDTRSGVIQSVLPKGRAGFLRDEAGRAVYFHRSAFRGKPNKMMPGQKVVWIAGTTYDPKKKVESESGVYVHLI